MLLSRFYGPAKLVLLIMDHASLFTEVVYAYLPKLCSTIYQILCIPIYRFLCTVIYRSQTVGHLWMNLSNSFYIANNRFVFIDLWAIKKETSKIERLRKAERKGFEPLIPFRVYTLSRRAPSTTRTPLLVYLDGLARGLQKYNFPAYLPNIFCAFSVVIRATSSTETPFTSASFAAIYFR